MTSTPSYARSFVRDNAVIIAGNILVSLKSFILMPIIIKSMGLSVYGGFILLTSFLGFVLGISAFGIWFKARRFMPGAVSMDVRRKLFIPQFYFNMLSIALFSLLLFIFDGQLRAYLFKNEINYTPIIIPCYLFAHFIYSQGTDYFRYTSRVHLMTLAGVVSPYIHILFVVAYLYWIGSLNINYLVLSEAFAALMIAFPCFVVIQKEIKLHIIFYRLKDAWADIKLGFPLALSNIVDFILAASDRYVISFFLSVAAVGAYVPSYALGSLMILVPKAMAGTIPQLLSQAVDGDRMSEARKIIDYALKIFLMLSIPFFFASLILTKPLLLLLANKEAMELAYFVPPIVALGTIFYGLSMILLNILYVRMETVNMFRVNALVALFNLLANMVLIYFFRDITIAALTTLASYVIGFVCVYRLVTRNWMLNVKIVTIVKLVVSAILMSVAIFLCNRMVGGVSSLEQVLIGMMVGTVTYVGSVYLLKIISDKEKQYIINLIGRRTR